MPVFPDKYDHIQSEKKWQEFWESGGVHSWDSSATRRESYVIDTPPPTVSGVLHMGHIFSYTQADFMARFMRMKGKSVFYPIGFDDNGLPTERLVEKIRKIRATDMPREDFIKICQEVVAEAEEDFRALFRSVALSVDWKQEYQTISPASRKISQMSFLDLAGKNEAYRRLEPTLWDTADRTALAQADIIDQELPGVMNEIEFSVEGGKLKIATTRPELLGACVAVFCHPDDKRYASLRGKTAVTPIYNAEVPILADDKVDMEKGTGLVMCCTFGDQTDVYWWKTHSLPLKIVLDKAGRITEGQLAGLKVKEAKEKIIELLKEAGALVSQTEIRHAVKCAERSGTPLEILVTPQWFIKVLDKKEALLAKAAECRWHPEYMKARLDNWINGLSWDWCISRQRYFGVPFPVWYSKRAGEEGKVLLAHHDDLPVNPLVDLPRGYKREEVEPDVDVMDTWATSSVSPQLCSQGISAEFAVDAGRHAKLFPADLRPQAHEIIRTWAFYTIVKAHLHQNSVPWKNLMISGWCLASDKTKMSKSKGNVVTPVGLIEEKSADAVRYWASTSRLGADTAFSEDVLKIGKKLVTKLWNAAKFASVHIEKAGSGNVTATMDKWIISRLGRVVEKATKEFENYEYSDARAAVEEFFWNDFCDNYLEFSKTRAYGEGEGAESAALAVKTVLDALLRLFAPFIPHITEELYQIIFAPGKSVHSRGNWPNAADYKRDEKSESEGNAAVAIMNAIRKFKSDGNVSIKFPIETLSIKALKGEAPGPSALEDLKNVANAGQIKLGEAAGGIETEDGGFAIEVKLGEKEDAA